VKKPSDWAGAGNVEHPQRSGRQEDERDHRRLSESWNKLLEEGHWKDFTILVSDFIEVSRNFFCIFLTKRQPKTFKSIVLY